MKKMSIEIKEVGDILKINKLIEKSKYDKLNVDVGIGEEEDHIVALLSQTRFAGAGARTATGMKQNFHVLQNARRTQVR